MAIPRSVFPAISMRTVVQCHIFSDASLKAYGAVAYIRVVDAKGQVSVSFLCSKSRVAPMKMDGSDELTLPKLELTAALIAARLCEYLRSSLKIPIKEYFLWTDSKITLNWIYGQLQKWKPYVQTRVEEIRRHTSVADWSHCSGKDNPADLVTRGISGEKLQSSAIWIGGPSWLKVPVLDTCKEIADCQSQLNLLTQTEESIRDQKKKEPMEAIVNFQNFSTWLRLLRVTCWVLRFVHRRQSFEKFLTEEELRDAELYWLRYVHRTKFTNEYFSLKKTGVLELSSKILKLSPLLDDNRLIRVGGRLQMLEETYDIKHPIILSSDHHITDLIVDDFHRTTLHGGVNTVLAKIRERFWVIKGRQVVKKRINSCIVCKKLFGQPASQPFAPLPLHRVTLDRPFNNVGIDFAGPLFYITDDGSSMRKAYLLVFTCAAVRAVHIELTTSMSTDSCIMALRRFIARRGTPSAIYSDNAKSFRRASFELRGFNDVLQGEGLPDFLANSRIRWNFIVERAPWWGGFWERMIRTIKNVLKTVIGKAKLNFEQLRTLLTEAEALVNERPLTYLSEDVLGSPPLTPAQFLHMRSTTTGQNLSKELNSSGLRELWQHRMKYFAKMTIRWRIEYMQQLRSFHSSNPKTSKQLRVGDVVLLYDSAKPRIQWEMVMVNQTFEGRDGKVRACEVRFADRRLMRRPVQLLYPLELANSARAAGC
ncbi:uncharacterized protein LOC129947130 [Eupeodes corollae]|uniref:uncharacterized protein LOC129947130 n=1 Tax=Eupeodes corollae TaxID=290404 RepID=UPI0024920F07|nr:uncharacterized protein LOC129947130 [Eupeodes corollae]